MATMADFQTGRVYVVRIKGAKRPKRIRVATLNYGAASGIRDHIEYTNVRRGSTGSTVERVDHITVLFEDATGQPSESPR